MEAVWSSFGGSHVDVCNEAVNPLRLVERTGDMQI